MPQHAKIKGCYKQIHEMPVIFFCKTSCDEQVYPKTKKSRYKTNAIILFSYSLIMQLYVINTHTPSQHTIEEVCMLF